MIEKKKYPIDILFKYFVIIAPILIIAGYFWRESVIERENQQLHDYTEHTGEIISISPVNKAVYLKYRYTVNGESYERRIEVDNRFRQRTDLVNTEIKIIYANEDPSVSRIISSGYE